MKRSYHLTVRTSHQYKCFRINDLCSPRRGDSGVDQPQEHKQDCAGSWYGRSIAKARTPQHHRSVQKRRRYSAMPPAMRWASRTEQTIMVRRRDPEDRPVASNDISAVREKMFDKTLADSYPASDPPSTIPNPSADSIGLGNMPPVAEGQDNARHRASKANNWSATFVSRS